MLKNNKEKFTVDLELNNTKFTEQLKDVENAISILNNNDTKPNITIRDNDTVYVTINNFNETEKEYFKKEE